MINAFNSIAAATTHESLFTSSDLSTHIHCAIQLETLVRSDGIGVELLQIDTFLSQKLPFHSIIIRVKMVAYSGIFKKNYSLLRPCSF